MISRSLVYDAMKPKTITSLYLLIRNYAFLTAVAVVLSGCGTAGKLQPACVPTPSLNVTDGTNLSPSAVAPDLSPFSKAVVMDFENKSSTPVIQASLGKTFADQVAEKLKEKNIFQTVSRAPLTTEESKKGQVLILKGKITDYDDGNAALRMWIGFGAGRSHFYGTVHLWDSSKNQEIAAIHMKIGSWLLGGIVASTMGADELSNQAANHIADEILKHKQPAKGKTNI